MPTLIIHAKIHTMNAAMPRAEAAVVNDGRFMLVGSEAAARAWLDGQTHDTVDAKGCSVTPGFNDSHMHWLGCALQARRVALDGVRSVDEMIGRLRGGLGRATGGWVIGRGWNQERFDQPAMPTRADLDRVSADVPVLATRACGHIAVANSRALAIAGIDPPDGMLREDAQDAVWRKIPAPGSTEKVDAMVALQGALYQKGITSVQSDDLDGVDDAGFLACLRDAGDSGRLKVRCAEQARPGCLASLRAFLAEGLHAVKGRRMHVSCIKLMADGSLGARTASLQAPYADAPNTRGIALYSRADLHALVREAASHGLPVAVHAIGDAAMERALDAIAEEGRGLRHAIVHAQITTAEQVLRCGRMGMSILAQPIFLDADVPIVRARVGDALFSTSYRWRSMLAAGAMVAFGTDSPVEPFDPLPNLYCAMARRTLGGGAPYLPEEGFSLDEALYAYTAAGAFASGEEADKGRIQAGMLADFVLFDTPFDSHEPETVRGAKVVATYIGGERVFGI